MKVLYQVNKSLKGYTVKPVYNGHSREPPKVAVIDRWPLYRGSTIWPHVSLYNLFDLFPHQLILHYHLFFGKI